jgi:short subunit dehydrogenase-like uncharacterized protein
MKSNDKSGFNFARTYLTGSLVNKIQRIDKSFSETLLRYIADKGKTEVEVYKRAYIDRRLFSKIRKGDYIPRKRTVLTLAVALELTLDETAHLLEQAGFSLSPVQMFDLIVAHSISKGRYDIDKINEVLFHYGQPLLGV